MHRSDYSKNFDIIFSNILEYFCSPFSVISRVYSVRFKVFPKSALMELVNSCAVTNINKRRQ